MGIKYVWDTNVAIYYLQQQFPHSAEKFMDNVVVDFQPVISIITEIELLCWKTERKKDLEIVHDFVNDVLIIELEHTVKLKTVDIRRKHRIKLPDAIIAASAIVYKLDLITRNTKDFKDIEGLKLINPWDV